MNVIPLILQLIALVMFCFRAFHLFEGPGKPHWGWFGAAVLTVSMMIGEVHLHSIQ